MTVTTNESYSFFGSPSETDLPVLKRKSAPASALETKRTSYPDLVTYQNRRSVTHQVEDWIMDTSYGYFDAPTLHPEPLNRRSAPASLPKRAMSTPVQTNYDGYSFFGI